MDTRIQGSLLRQAITNKMDKYVSQATETQFINTRVLQYLNLSWLEERNFRVLAHICKYICSRLSGNVQRHRMKRMGHRLRTNESYRFSCGLLIIPTIRK